MVVKTSLLYVAVASLSLSGAALIFSGCGGTGEGLAEGVEPKKPIEVTTAICLELPIERRVEVVGTLLAHEQVVLSSEVSGTVFEVHVDFGSSVRKGQPLVELDPREFELAVEHAEAILAQNLSVLGLSPDGNEAQIDVNETAQVKQAASALADVKTKLKSARKLIKTNDIPEQRYLELQHMKATREAALKEARERVRSQIASVKARRVDLALARKNLSDTRYYAPFNGSVVTRHVAVGQYVKENSPLITIAQTDPIRLRIRIPEVAAAKVVVGMPISFQTDAHPNRVFKAQVTDVSPILDSGSRTLVAEAILQNSEQTLRPGMFCRGSLLVSENSMVAMVPDSALLAFAGLTKVFVVQEDKTVSERVVQTGITDDGLVEVLDDAVNPGEKVVTSSLDQLAQGITVTEK